MYLPVVIAGSWVVTAQEFRSAFLANQPQVGEGGTGDTVRRTLLHKCDVHTIRCLPSGIFYVQGV